MKDIASGPRAAAAPGESAEVVIAQAEANKYVGAELVLKKGLARQIAETQQFVLLGCFFYSVTKLPERLLKRKVYDMDRAVLQDHDKLPAGLPPALIRIPYKVVLVLACIEGKAVCRSQHWRFENLP